MCILYTINIGCTASVSKLKHGYGTLEFDQQIIPIVRGRRNTRHSTHTIQQ